MKLQGDELISTNKIVSTRAINIQAPKEKYGRGLLKQGKTVVVLTATMVREFIWCEDG